MSGASMNQIKSRMRSVKSTMQITRAMELVATSKLPRARGMAQGAEDFARAYEQALSCLVADDCLRWRESESDRVLYIVIAGDRGLAGGYNSGVLRLAPKPGEGNSLFLPLGKKAMDAYAREGGELFSDGAPVSDIDMGECLDMARQVCCGFTEGAFGRVELIYTRFVSMLSQLPMSQTLLPFGGEGDRGVCDAVIDSDRDQLTDALMPEYVGALLYGAVCQAKAAESAARRTAMNAANKNAEEMIEGLTLNYNRARQAVITGEITEIVSGAGAL